MKLAISTTLFATSVIVSGCATNAVPPEDKFLAASNQRVPSSVPPSFAFRMTALLDVHRPREGVGITYVYQTNSPYIVEITCAIDVTMSRAMVVSLAPGPRAEYAFSTRKDCNAVAGMQAGLVNTGTQVFVTLSKYDGNIYREVIFNH